MIGTEYCGPVQEPALQHDTTRRITALDGLRGLAVLGVLLFHSGNLAGGYLGVDAFFVLSGFLITGLLLAEVSRTGGVALGAFWARRARRLLPALFLVILGAAAYAYIFAERSEMTRIRGDAFATVAYVANWHSIFTSSSYSDLFSAPSPLQHTWSLAIEEQFYMLWPLMVFGIAAVALRRKLHAARTVFWSCAGAALVAIAWTVFLARSGATTDRLYYGTDTRAPALLMGAALAAWVAWRGHVPSQKARITIEVLAIIAIVTLAASWSVVEFSTRALYSDAALAGLGLLVGLVILAIAHPERGPLARALAIPPLVGLGLISYGLYLWHWPVYAVLTESRMGFDGWGLTAVRIGASLILALASYFLIESPIRHGALHGWVARVATPGVAFVVVAVMVLVTTTAGSPARANAESVSLPKDGATSAAETQQRLKVLEDARIAAAARPPRILLVGDSVAWSLGVGMEDVAGEFGAEVLNASRVGCVLTTGLDSLRSPNFDGSRSVFAPDACDTDWATILTKFDPDLVVLLLGGRAPLSEWQIGGDWVDSCSPTWADWYRSVLPPAFDQLGRGGAKVLLGTFPHVTPARNATTANRRVECVNQVHVAVQSEQPKVGLMDLDGFLCPDANCTRIVGDVIVRPDGFHFSRDGGQWLARQTLPLLVSAARDNRAAQNR
ncbi:MAG: acyltransferase family protein [Acidimicrobiia bacterium]